MGLAGALAQLDPNAEDERQARASLLSYLGTEIHGFRALPAVGVLSRLGLSADQRSMLRQGLYDILLAGQTNGMVAGWLCDWLPELAMTDDERAEVRTTLTATLADLEDGWVGASLVRALTRLHLTAGDRREVRELLLSLLVRQQYGQLAAMNVGAILRLEPTATDLRRARGALLDILATQKDVPGSAGVEAGTAVQALVLLDPSTEERRCARQAMLDLLAVQTDDNQISWCESAIADLSPTVSELRQMSNSLSARTLAAARQNTPLEDWLNELTSLSEPQ